MLYMQFNNVFLRKFWGKNTDAHVTLQRKPNKVSSHIFLENCPWPQNIWIYWSGSSSISLNNIFFTVSLSNSSPNRSVCRSCTSLPCFWLFAWNVAQHIYLAVCMNIESVSLEFKDKKLFVVSHLYLLSKT